MSSFAIGYTRNEKLGEEIGTLEFALHQLTGESVARVDLSSAGPDFFLLMANHADWIHQARQWIAEQSPSVVQNLIADAIGALAYGGWRLVRGWRARRKQRRLRAIAKRLGERGSEWLRIAVDQIRSAAVKGVPAGFTVVHPRLSRGGTLMIRKGLDDRADVLWRLLNFALCAEAIYAAIEAEVVKLSSTASVEGKIAQQWDVEIRDDGSVWMFGRSICMP